MTPEVWNPDEALVDVSEDDTQELASLWRYGVTGWEATHAEPLDLALAQEQPETTDDQVDEQWAESEPDSEPFAGRLLADDAVGDDDYAVAIEDPEEYSPEELAMHVVEL